MLGLGLSLTSRAVLGGGIAVPTILFSGSTVAEDAALDQVIGTLSVSNGSGSYTFTLTGSDGSRVSLTTATIKRGATALDYETHPTIVFSVSADNGVDTPLTRTFAVAVTDVVEDVTRTFGTPTLAWVSAADNDIPEFDVDDPDDSLIDTDVIRFQRDADGGDFSAPSLEIAHAVTSAELLAGTFDFGFTAWSDDEYDTRVRYENADGSVVGDWSNTEDVVIATVAASPTGYRYWEITADAVTSDTGFAVKEFVLRDNTVDVSAGIVPVISSSFDPDGNPASAVSDRNSGTFHITSMADSSAQTYRFDLGSGNEANVNSIGIQYWISERAPTILDVKHYDDNTWTGGTSIGGYSGLIQSQLGTFTSGIRCMGLAGNMISNNPTETGTTTDWFGQDDGATLAVVSGELEVTAVGTSGAGTIVAYGLKDATDYELTITHRKGPGTAIKSRIDVSGSALVGGTASSENTTTTGLPETVPFTTTAAGSVAILCVAIGGTAGDKAYFSDISLVEAG